MLTKRVTNSFIYLYGRHVSFCTYLKIILLTLHVATWTLIVVVVVVVVFANDFFKCVLAKCFSHALANWLTAANGQYDPSMAEGIYIKVERTLQDKRDLRR